MFVKCMIYTILSAGLLFLSGCSKSNLHTMTIEKEFAVYSSDSTYSEFEEVNMFLEWNNFHNYRDDISFVDLKEITYTITYFDGSQNHEIISAILLISDTTGSPLKEMASISNVNLFDVTGVEQSLSINSEGEDKFIYLITNSPHKFRLYFDGETNEAPVDFKVKFKLKAELTYQTSWL